MARRRIPRPKPAPLTMKVIEERKAICKACDLFKADEEKCCHPLCKCPVGWWRYKPWERMVKCGDGKW